MFPRCPLPPAAGALSPLGARMAEFPLDPVLCRVVVAAGARGSECLRAVAAVVAMLSVQAVFYAPRSTSKQQAAAEAKARFVSADGMGLFFQ